MDNNMGWVYLAEESNAGNAVVKNLQKESIDSIFVVTFETCLQSFDVMNRNKRMYTAKNVMDCIQTDERIQECMKCGGWFGEMGHPVQVYKDLPLTPERIYDVSQDRRSHKISNPRIEGNLLMATIQTAAAAKGPGFAAEILTGLIPNFSSRAIAALNNVGGKPMVTVKKLITYDWVLFPSHKEAHMTSKPSVKGVAVNESSHTMYSSDVIIPLQEILECVKESDRNVNTIMESFGLEDSDFVAVTPNKKQFVFKDHSNRIFINTDVSSKRKIDDFFGSF